MKLISKLEKSFVRKSGIKSYPRISGIKVYPYIWTVRDLSTKLIHMIKLEHHVLDNEEKRGEGLKFRCTAKGRKEGSTNVNFMVGIAHNKGIVLCEQWDGRITGEKFACNCEVLFQESASQFREPKGQAHINGRMSTPKLKSSNACHKYIRCKGF